MDHAITKNNKRNQEQRSRGPFKDDGGRGGGGRGGRGGQGSGRGRDGGQGKDKRMVNIVTNTIDYTYVKSVHVIGIAMHT